MIKLVARGAVGLAAVLWLAGCSSASDAQDARYYVDYAKGSDSNTGLTPGAAWRHAPGDPAASGRPAGTRLAAGDHVIFAPGVVYRGEVQVTGKGTKERPIVFEGGEGNAAIFNGSDPVSFTPCESAARCGGHPAWQKLVRVTLDAPLGKGSLFSDGTAGGQLLLAARTPNPVDPFYRDDLGDMLIASPAELARGVLRLPPELQGASLAEGARVALWVAGNLVIRRPITAITGDTLHFDPTGIRFYTDRPGKYAVIGLAPSLDQPGEYVELPGGRALVAMLPEGVKALSVARGRGGFLLDGAAYVTIRNLVFQQMGDNGELRGGRAIATARSGEGTGIEIVGNRFFDMDMRRGQGVISLRKIDNLVISGNRIEGVALGSGMRLGSSVNVTVEKNRIFRVGRTGIMLMNVKEALVEDNLLADIKGVHGNAISAYLDNQHLRFVGNTVLDSSRPVTFHGTKKAVAAGFVNDIEFRDNLLVATPGALGSLIAWGESTRGVKITGNILLGGRFGLRMKAGNAQFVIRGNAGVRPVQFKGEPSGWQVEGNSWFTGAAPSWAVNVLKASRQATKSGNIPQAYDCRDIPVPVTRVGATLLCTGRQ